LGQEGGMNGGRCDNCVLAMDVVRPDTELFVVTDAGYGKRSDIEEYPVKGRGTMGVKTISLTEKKGGVAGALIVREHHDLVFISQSGMVQRTSVKGISKQGRPAQGLDTHRTDRRVGDQQVEHGAHRQGSNKPDRHIALRILGFFCCRGHRVEADVGKEDRGRRAQHADTG